MRRLLVLLVSAVLVATSCAGTGDIDVAADVAQTTAVAEPTKEPVVEVRVPTGRVALAAAQGSAHVLWFWGAH